MDVDNLEREANNLCLEDLEQLRDFCDALITALESEAAAE